MMTTLKLEPHPSTPCSWIDAVAVTIARNGTGEIILAYEVNGRIDRLRIPRDSDLPERSNELWRHTCFELFVRKSPGPGYVEYNFSPSRHWAAYEFESYRQGRHDFPADAPVVTCKRQADSFSLSAALRTTDAGDPAPQVALSAVLEDEEGRLYYWALRHPDGAPDFHHDTGFAARL